jgi:hypothetical protein
MWWKTKQTNELATHALEMADAVQKLPVVITVADKFRKGQVDNSIYELRRAFMQLPISPTTRQRYASNRTYISFQAPYPHRRKTVSLFDFLIKKLQTVDFVRADSRALMRIVDILNEEIPRKIRDAETEYTLEGWSNEEKNNKDVDDAIERAIAEATALPSTLSGLHAEVQDEAGNILASDIAFPDISMYSELEELSAELEALKLDWEHAHSLPMETEDEFTIEQVALSYLPDALVLFERFRRRTKDETNHRAKDLLLEQVKLIRKQVTFVLEQHTEDSFSQMEAHMNFLKAKNDQLGL